jgi:spore coat protein A
MKNRCSVFLTLFIFIPVSILALATTDSFAAIANINPIIDNTVAEELPDNSSGECDSIFSGTTDQGVGSARRALMQFDIAGNLPPGAVVTSVTLSMTVTRGSNHVDSDFTLHPINAAWIEGVEGCGVRGGGQGEPSTGGVTWNTMPGFGAASGITLINNTTPVWNSTPAMVADVQSWLDSPGTNYGWMLIGDENNPTTTRRFDSSEGASPPVLTVEFDSDGFACCFDTGDCNIQIDESSCLAAGGDQFLPGVDTCEPNPCPQPTGACCNADNTCTEDQDRLVCEDAGGTFVGGNCNQADCGLTPFVEPLPIPPILQPTGTRADGVLQYTVSVEEATQSVHPELPNTDVWTYNGAWPAATIVATKGQPIEVTYINNLPSGGGGQRGNNLLEVDTCAHGSKRIVTHLHGGHVPARVDGQPEYHILPGESDIYEYPNNQDAATLWYHDHALGITRLNVYGGMAGYYLLADSEDTLGPDNAFGLPSGQYEIGLAIQDRQFNADGSLFYNAQLEDAFKGDSVVVNGKIQPFLNVDQGKYRFRILNGSQSREYSLRLENITMPGNDPSFILVGTDVGLVSAPFDLGNTISIYAPAERMDVVIDFAGYPAGTEIILRNDDLTSPLLPSIMKFVVTGNPGYTGTIATTLREVIPMPENSADVTRYFRLEKLANKLCKDASGRLVNEWVVQSLDGPGGNVIGEFWDDLTEFPILGTREVWEFENPTSVMHPMHVHLVKFQILSKEMIGGSSIPLEPWEDNTWKDTVRVPANSRARIIMDFTDYLGRFPQHCHILDHEDHEMMRQFQTTNDPANAVVDGVCSEGEDCVSNPADCALVSGALCGNGLCEAGDGENCITCPEDCAGKQKGSASGQFCCGFDDGQVTNPILCGEDANDDRCINSRDNLFCRVDPRLEACCGDKLCEGQETEFNCAVDCAPGTCTPTGVSESICNGVDDDCDGQIDEDYVTTPTTCGVGECAGNTGQLECQNGTEVDTCDPFAGAVPEVCDDPGMLDEDCDGLANADDPDCQQVVCKDITNRNECRNTPGCEWVGGKNGTCQDACTPSPEGPPGDPSCTDTIDNDCDGLTDADDPDCQECIPTEPGTELTCDDGIDNDCDGFIDTADPDCPQDNCSIYGDRDSCNADPNCKWRSQECQPR